MVQSMGLQRVRHDRVTELNGTLLTSKIFQKTAMSQLTQSESSNYRN